MDGQVSKRRRVYSLEPNEKGSSLFARKYVNHLVPALMKINQKKSISSDENGVDMAMVLSADESAWSAALKQKLQTNVNAGGFQNSSSHHLTALNSHFTCGQKSNCIIEENPNTKPKIKKPIRPQSLVLPLRKGNIEESEEEKISCQLKNLRKLLPGGNELDVDVLLTELGSYITCLELQVNVLQCLVETH